MTAVCGTENLELVRGLGADRVIDYTVEEFTQDEQRYDAVFDAVGKSSFGRCRRLLKPGGIYGSTDLGPLSLNPLLALVTPLLGPLSGAQPDEDVGEALAGPAPATGPPARRPPAHELAGTGAACPGQPGRQVAAASAAVCRAAWIVDQVPLPAGARTACRRSPRAVALGQVAPGNTP